MRHVRWTAVVVGFAALGPTDAAVGQAGSNYEELQTFTGVLNHLRSNYVDSVSYARLVRAAIDGMLRSLDPHSRFESREEVARAAALARGELGTVGIVLEDVDGVPTVLAVVPDGPADRKGVLPGDRLLALDDSTMAGRDAESLMLRMAGPSGSRVRLAFERGPRLEPRRYEVTIKRDDVKQPSVGVTRLLDPATGYVRLAHFGADAADELEKAVNGLRRSGARQLVLDLRGNPGGIVVASVEVASLFLPKATLVFRTRGRKSTVDEEYITKKNGRFVDLPLVVLMDEQSASASEALAGSLQDHDRALLVGRRSFGKALMQGPFVLPGGDVVWLTIGRVLTPSGRFIQRRYAGLAVEQYYGLAGQGGSEQDTAEVFQTDAGREVRGGGGIRPDIEVPPGMARPAWHAVAADSGFEEAVADSVAYALPASDAGRAAWLSAPERWQAELLDPFLQRVRERLRIPAAADTALHAALARRLAARVALVRWGAEARDELWLTTDPVVTRAREAFGRMEGLLAAPAR
ncbi:MAG: S41 family peptidase [Gemmatimonadota bacterium]|nr:S41 family peptidase [Gemmatimonadota bacterium]MDH4351996.1 S41 family peptidase [Gemmatimonadota bacterium]MDH5195748.1 S41 family peptidase [Gemmatimonadota bacterium]